MRWRHLRAIVIAATVLILVASVAGPVILLEGRRQSFVTGAEATLERAAQAVENALNRQLLQVHGALASLPALFAAAGASPQTPFAASQLLRGLNFQTLAYRDLLLVQPDGTVVAAARQTAGRHAVALDFSELAREPIALIGPVRNAQTGQWTLYVARTVPAWRGVIALAEIPLLALVDVLAETQMPPGSTLRLERPNGLLIAAFPHDELGTGRLDPGAPKGNVPEGKAIFEDTADGFGEIAVLRTSLYSDVRVVLTQDLRPVLANWERERDRTVLAVLIRSVLVIASGAALLFALRQRERADAERARSAAVVASAIDAMSDGFVMWDEQDRFVMCNQRYRELFPLIAPLLRSGLPYEEMLRRGVQLGQYPQATANPEAFIERTLRAHRNSVGPVEILLPDGRWLLMHDRPMDRGGIVSIRTDVTPLKQALAELAEANHRANEAMQEAQRQNEALAEQESRIRFLAHHDELTRLPNRVLLQEQIGAALRFAEDRGTPIALLYLDLDRFKEVNDTLGHQVGDALLRTVAKRIAACLDQTDGIARLGGDEFAVISLSPGQPAGAQALGERIIRALSQPYEVLGHTIGTSVSIGVALGDARTSDPDTLLQRADLALYEAKARGRSTVCVFAPEMEARLRDRLQMEADLRAALAEGQFHLAYQPIFALPSGERCGFEALLRWNHPTRGPIPPDAFIAVAEETRLIVDIGAWVLRRACTDVGALPGTPRIAVNLSPVQLAVGDIAATLAAILGETGIDPARVEIEITETALFTGEQRNRDTLRRLKALGVRTVLDDFGTGFSSLSHLRLFPLDKIKIDRSFIHDMAEHADSAAIVEAIAGLARRLGIDTTAEGIETEEQLAIIRRIGCTEAQGYLLGQPGPLDGDRRS
ncbi:diguanylate cyclase (GGDEF)-like protein [Kaistia hirudinis]|uniref:Diguanylate cyclase (GGDEF)-like protein n=1 Tax=Kaistia hirudinis TaxID=1293440 RepID=A0A840AND6_9HYPH|nr:EAL domain-containing protein [Kaistia hirudinis]MBB3930824.1 diguanylate cyclase (GGDEF)-like protein [Kaistia hirudinis]